MSLLGIFERTFLEHDLAENSGYPFGVSSPSDLTVSIGICSVSTNMHRLCVEVVSEIIMLCKTRRLTIEVFWDVPLCR